MKRTLIPSDLENRVLLVVLTCLLVVSTVGSIMNIGARWQVPLIFLALLAIIRLLRPVAEIHLDVKYLRGLSASAKVNPFTNVATFYEDLRHALVAAESTVDLTHIRDTPPAHFAQQSKGWFETAVEWAGNESSRSLRRIISARTEAMLAWASELRKLTDAMPNFQVRVVDWNINAPAINMALLDDKLVYLAISGEVFERTKGIVIKDAVVASYFCQYYEKLWSSARPVGEYLDSLRDGATNPPHGV